MSRPLEQEPAAERSRRLVERGSDDPVEVEAADVHARRDVLAVPAGLDALDERVEEAAEAVPCDAHAAIFVGARRRRLAVLAL
jgi:hypothetical protein